MQEVEPDRSSSSDFKGDAAQMQGDRRYFSFQEMTTARFCVEQTRCTVYEPLARNCIAPLRRRSLVRRENGKEQRNSALKPPQFNLTLAVPAGERHFDQVMVAKLGSAHNRLMAELDTKAGAKA
jgi:hypothetical protein